MRVYIAACMYTNPVSCTIVTHRLNTICILALKRNNFCAFHINPVDLVLPPVEYKPGVSSLPLLSTQQVATHHLNCTLLTTFNGNIGTSYFFSKHILWLFFFQFKVIMMLPYGKIPETFLPSSKRATGTFILQISKLILHAAHVLNIPRRCALKSRATNTPMKNEAFKAASWCSKFESTLNNKENQH